MKNHANRQLEISRRLRDKTSIDFGKVSLADLLGTLIGEDEFESLAVESDPDNIDETVIQSLIDS